MHPNNIYSPFKIEELFPTPIYVSMIPDADKVQQELDGVFDSLDFIETPKSLGVTHKSTGIGTQCIIDKFNLFELKKTIIVALKTYLGELGQPITPFKTESWMTSFETGEYAPVHDHCPADISGVYYYRTSGEDGNIFFETPNPISKTSPKFALRCGSRWIQNPVPGKLILFPGWLPHGVMTNTTDSVRHSLSFNIYFNR